MNKTVYALLLAATLAGCTRNSLVDAWKLNKVKMATTDVNRLRVAVHVPAYFHLRKPGAVMTLTLTRTRSKPAQSERFVLQEIPASQELKDLVLEEGPEGNYHVFRLKPGDIARFEHIRGQTGKNTPGGRRRGSLRISASVCRTTTRLPKKILFSTFLKARETGEYVAIVRDMDLLSGMGHQNINRAAPPCAGH